MAICKFCGGTINEDSGFCEFCGGYDSSSYGDEWEEEDCWGDDFGGSYYDDDDL